MTNTDITLGLKGVAEDLADLRDVEASLKARRKELMQDAHDSGMTYQAIGDALGVTKAYVHQQIGKHRVKVVEPEPEVITFTVPAGVIDL